MPCYKVRTHHRASSWGRSRECSEGGDRIQEIRKLRGNFLSMALLKSYPNKDSAALVIQLNSTSLSLNSFLLSLTSASISKHAHPFIALLDSGSSHCFVDEVFAKKNKIALTKLLSTILLQLFDSVGRITVHYATHLQGWVLASGAFTLITGPECNHWTAFLFRFPETHFPKVVRIAMKLYH